MSANPPNGPSSSPGSSGFSATGGQFPGGPPPWQSGPSRRQPGALTFLALALAAVAIILAVVDWLRPVPAAAPAAAPAGEPTYSEQQIADAHHDVCGAYALVRSAVSVSTHKQSPDGGNFADTTAIAANSRLALYGGAGYLLQHLARQPATRSELAGAINSLADTLQQLAMVDLSEQPESTQKPLREAVPNEIAKLDELCK